MKLITGSGGGCFPAGVMILTPDGETAIELLEIGDEVLSFDYEGNAAVSVVDKIHRHSEDTVSRLYYWGGSLRITDNHWVLNQYNAFALAGTMTEHDALIDSIGHLRPVIGIRPETLEPVFNLSVIPNHTFIADGIRVHNGGRGRRRPVVGGGGGDKGGGGSSRTAVEDPDSLQSHQYAKIIDLLSEGPIGGLVDGLKSVYLNDTPVQSKDGTTNFTGVTLDSRTGTNDQTAVAGFTDVENEISINVEVKHATPVVRTISGDIDAARVTVGIPCLTQQDITNGDLHGSSVQLSFELQNNGGGYEPLPTVINWVAETGSGLQFDTNAQGVGMTLNITFPFTEYWVEDNYGGNG